ncbi:uncharacterized protein LOC111706022 [Eurytemora carolleeae]|uniref:uncharacterized protein LOC111706022 n=1 Tax=Eurytemora carolleeae TaxID=1294199 RepID=UPI000C759325|nr:uncharacterized protein LOC111706022 [Eurytemora carolleeae]|eukprot:XP_023334540.1 uncharacterized protein LOC111706022 [Eurytemora affinis]
MFPTALLWAGLLGTLLLVEPGIGRRGRGGRESSRGGRGGGRESSREFRPSMWADQANLVSMMQSSLIAIKPTIFDINLNDMMRPICFLGQVSESDMPGFYEPKKFVYRNTSEKSDVPNVNRAAPPPSRASNAKTQTQVKPFPHKPKKDDPQGCGNPVCVIIDSKPRRFKSLCEFKSFLQTENRLSQVNFVQKGDCYDIIDNPEGAEKKTWSDNAKDCSMCRENDLCNGPIVVVVDLGSYLNGKSSAPGGGIHKENSEEGTKQSGIPFEFCSICEAMKFFENSENLNIATQLVGIGFGKTCNLFPLNG